MQKQLTIAMAVTVISLLGAPGCSLIPKDIRQPYQSDSMFGDSYTENLAKTYFGDGKSDTEKGILYDRIREFHAALNETIVTKDESIKTDSKQRAKQIRDQATYDLLRISDKLYGDFKDTLFADKATMDTLFKISDLALTGTAAAVGDKGTKTALAAAATFLGGSKLAIDENFYAKQTTASLISIMDGMRAETKTKIINGLNKGPDEFTINHALSLVQEYHRRGSLVEAVVELSRITNADSQEKISALTTLELPATPQSTTGSTTR